MIYLTNCQIDPTEIAAIVTGRKRRVVLRSGAEIPVMDDWDEKALLRDFDAYQARLARRGLAHSSSG